MSASDRPRVRCFSCGSRQRADDECCGRCGVPFLVLCTCGAQHSVHDEACRACGLPTPVRRFPVSRLPAVRALRWTLAVALVAGPAALLLRQREETPWGLKERGLAHFRADEWTAAARDFEAATRLDARDKLAWFNLALTRQRLGLPRDAWIDAARRAAELDPGFADARIFLAAAAAQAGEVDEALAHAAAVLALDPDDPRASRLIAELELRRLRPELPRALAAVRTALRRDERSVSLRVLHAEICLALHGVQEPGAYPPDVEAALHAAREALDQLDGKRLPPTELASLRARIHLATGNPYEAYSAASQALEDLPAAAPAEERVPLLLLKARGLHAFRPSTGAARADFQAALALRPDAWTVNEVTRALLASGDAALAESLLSTAAERPDTAGAVAAGLAEVRLARGDVTGAAAAVARALAVRPSDPTLLLLEGRAHAASGHIDAARDSFRKAGELAPADVEPRLQSALLALAPADDAAARRAALAAAIADVGELVAERPSPGVLLVHAQLLAAAGEHAAAEAELVRVTAEAPSLVEAWTHLGEARLRRGSPEAAAEAFGRARTLRPDDASAHALEARALLAAGDSTGAVLAASRYLQGDRDSAPLREVRVEAYLSLELWDAALEDLRHLLAADPGSERLLLQAVETEIRAGLREAALRRIDGAPPTLSEPARALLLGLRADAAGQSDDEILVAARARGTSGALAVLEMRAGRYEDALATARKVLAAAPGDPVAAEILVLLLCDLAPEDRAALDEARRAVEGLGSSAAPGLASLLRARIALAEGRDDDASREAAEAVRSLPSHPVAAFVLGEAAYRRGDVAEGLASFRRAVHLPGAPPGYRRWAARRFADAAGREPSAARARDHATQALRLDPACLEATIVLARVLAGAGDPLGAADVLDRAARTPDLPAGTAASLRLDAALFAAVAGETSRALAYLDAVERGGTAPPGAALVRGWVCLASGRLDEAAAAFDRAAPSAAEEPGLALGRAALALESGDAAGGLAAVAVWRRAHPDDDFVPLGFAVRLRERGHVEDAVAVLRDVLRARPASRTAATALAGILVEEGRTDEAVAATQDWLAHASGADAAWARCLLADCLAQSPSTAGRALDAARTLAGQAETLPGIRVRAAAAESHALLVLGRSAEALERATQALRGEGPLAPEVESLLRHVEAMAAAALGDLPRAQAAATRCVELRPRDPVALNNAAWVLAQSSATAGKALDLARRATRLRPASPALWDTLAVAAAAASLHDEAEAAWTESLRLSAAAPGDDPAARARTALRFARHLEARDRRERAREVAGGVERFDPAPPADLLAEARALAGRP